MELSRLGVNTMTTKRWTIDQAAEMYEKHGIRNIGIWESMCDGRSGAQIRQLMRRHHMHVSHVCFGGSFTGESIIDRAGALERTMRSIEFSAEVEADCLLLVSGPIGTHGRDAALRLVSEGLAAVTPYAEERGLNLGLEPIHPMEITQWSVVTTMADAVALVQEVDSPYLGVYLDTYHIWWDPDVMHHIERCTGRIKGVHLADWRNPTRSFTDRTVPGQGVVPFKGLLGAIETAGYRGSYDVELFSDELWGSDYDALLQEIVAWFATI